jgi:cytosine/uracil/thiamine/allantoin permease
MINSISGRSEFSFFIGLFVGGVAYYLLAGRRIRAEGEATAAQPT